MRERALGSLPVSPPHSNRQPNKRFAKEKISNEHESVKYDSAIVSIGGSYFESSKFEV